MFNQLAKSLEPNPIEELLNNNLFIFKDFITKSKNQNLQIILTQINRDRKNKAHFRTFTYSADNQNYFDPAESIKLLIAIFALEKLNDLDFNGLNIDTFLKFIEDDENIDVSLKFENLKECVRKSLLFNNQNAANKLYDFIDRVCINKKIKYYGFKSSKIINRLGFDNNTDAERYTPEIIFYKDEKILYKKGASFDKFNYPIKFKNLNNNSSDILNKNAFQIKDQHELMLRLFFPETFPTKKRFNLKTDDYNLLYTYLGNSENVNKYFFYGANSNEYKLPHLKIFNNSGKSKNGLIDNAYFIDYENNTEFILSAVTNNTDGINDADHINFLKMLGRKVYELELKRDKKYAPDFSRMAVFK